MLLSIYHIEIILFVTRINKLVNCLEQQLTLYSYSFFCGRLYILVHLHLELFCPRIGCGLFPGMTLGFSGAALEERKL